MLPARRHIIGVVKAKIYARTYRPLLNAAMMAARVALFPALIDPVNMVRTSYGRPARGCGVCAFDAQRVFPVCRDLFGVLADSRVTLWSCGPFMHPPIYPSVHPPIHLSLRAGMSAPL